MHAHTSPPPLIWKRALVWSEHDARTARRRSRQIVVLCVAIFVMAMGFSMASYAFNQLLLAAMLPQAVPAPSVTSPPPVPYHLPYGMAPPWAWFPTW